MPHTPVEVSSFEATSGVPTPDAAVPDDPTPVAAMPEGFCTMGATFATGAGALLAFGTGATAATGAGASEDFRGQNGF